MIKALSGVRRLLRMRFRYVSPSYMARMGPSVVDVATRLRALAEKPLLG